MTDQLAHNGNIVGALISSLQRTDNGLDTTPGLLDRVLEENAWQEFVTGLGDHVRYDTFEQFLHARPLKGLGANVKLIRRIIGNDDELRNKVDQLVGNSQGERTDLVSNRHEVTGRPAGTTKEASLRRLRKKAPELHAKVVAGELSPNAAMVRAGLRTRTITVPVDPTRAARSIERHFSPDDIAALVKLLTEGAGDD